MLFDELLESKRSDPMKRVGQLARYGIVTYAWLLSAGCSGSPSSPAPLCAAGQHICNGNTIERCNPALNGYDFVTKCEPGTRCVAGQQQCASDSPEPGTVCGDGIIQTGERCDVAISQGTPGACPQQCPEQKGCVTYSLSGEGCQAECSRTTLTACTPNVLDGCCPSGCGDTDEDCVKCGNGAKDPGELCDTKLALGNGGCPMSDADCKDSDPCTQDKLVGTGCSAFCENKDILTPNPSTKDGCCRTGWTKVADADCEGCSYDDECPDKEVCHQSRCTRSAVRFLGQDCKSDENCASLADKDPPWCSNGYPTVRCGQPAACRSEAGVKNGAKLCRTPADLPANGASTPGYCPCLTSLDCPSSAPCFQGSGWANGTCCGTNCSEPGSQATFECK